VSVLFLQVFGEDMAVLSGDALLSYAFEYIARYTKGVPAEKVKFFKVLRDFWALSRSFFHNEKSCCLVFFIRSAVKQYAVCACFCRSHGVVFLHFTSAPEKQSMCISSHMIFQVLDIIARCGKCVGALGLVGGQVMDIQSEGNKDVTIETLQVPDNCHYNPFFLHDLPR
jgi:hypothetical protein